MAIRVRSITAEEAESLGGGSDAMTSFDTGEHRASYEVTGRTASSWAIAMRTVVHRVVKRHSAGR